MLKKRPFSIVLFVFSFLLVITSSCTKDDICPEGSPSTPQLIIAFMDIDAPSEVKEVPNLSVKLTSTQEVLFANSQPDTLFRIPLNVSATMVQYSFTSDDGGDNPNTDFVTINYERGEDIYINRACSFITTFNNISIDIQNEGSANWMLNSEITNPTVENEDVTHITIFH